MSPTIDEMQQAINHLIDRVLEVIKCITWQKKYSNSGTKDEGLSLSVCTCRKKKAASQIDWNWLPL